MFDVNSLQPIHRFAAAARKLMEEGVVDAASGRFSKTIFMGADSSGSEIERTAIKTAVDSGYSLVVLVFGRTGQAKGPRSLTVAVAGEDGAPRVFRDCALVENDDGRLIAVPRGRGADGHFVIGHDGLVHRPGRPATLGPGMVRASKRLVAAARELTHVGPSLSVHA